MSLQNIRNLSGWLMSGVLHGLILVSASSSVRQRPRGHHLLGHGQSLPPCPGTAALHSPLCPPSCPLASALTHHPACVLAGPAHCALFLFWSWVAISQKPCVTATTTATFCLLWHHHHVTRGSTALSCRSSALLNTWAWTNPTTLTLGENVQNRKPVCVRTVSSLGLLQSPHST